MPDAGRGIVRPWRETGIVAPASPARGTGFRNFYKKCPNDQVGAI